MIYRKNVILNMHSQKSFSNNFVVKFLNEIFSEEYKFKV